MTTVDQLLLPGQTCKFQLTWSLVPLHFLNPAWISGSSCFTYYWSLVWRILSITLLACAEQYGNLNSGSSTFFKSILNICKFSVHVLLKPRLENFEHYFASVWDECSCVIVWAFFGIAFLWDWNENWPFPVLWPLLSFPNLLAYWVRHFHSIFQDLQ